MSSRLAVVATHPIQYYAPLFRTLAARRRLELRVFYGWRGASHAAAYDAGFDRSIQWDIPLLEGYDYVFVPNDSDKPGTESFLGIDGKSLVPSIQEWAPTSVLIYGWRHASHLRALRFFHGRIPVLFRGDSTLVDERPGMKRLLRRGILKWVYRHVDVALYVGIRNREYFAKHGLQESQLTWAPHSVENERFIDTHGEYQAEASAWRLKLGISEESIVVLFAGKLERKKAPEILLERFLARHGANEHLVFAGTGPLEETLRERSRDDPRIHFLGFQNQSRMPVVYRLGDVFVLPSRGPGETWGLAVNEAMASGRPVIVSDHVGCAPDLVGDGKTGVVFSNDRAGSLDRALSRLLDSRELRQRFATAASLRIADWTLTEQALRIERAVESIEMRT